MKTIDFKSLSLEELVVIEESLKLGNRTTALQLLKISEEEVTEYKESLERTRLINSILTEVYK